MLRLISEGTSLDLSTNTVIRFKMVSPVFSLNYIPTAQIFNIELPPTSLNLRLFNSLNLIELNQNLEEEIPVNIEMDGVTIFKGTMRVIDAITFTCEYKSLPQAFIEDFADMSIQDFDYDGARTLWPSTTGNVDSFDTYLKGVVAGSVDSYDFALGSIYAPFNSSMLSSIDNCWLYDRINYYVRASDRDSNNYAFFHNGSSAPLALLFIPFPYLTYVISKIFEEANIELESTILNDAEFKKLTIFSNNPMWVKTDYDTYPGKIIMNGGRLDWTVSEQLPDVTVRNFLKSLRIKFNVIFDFHYIQQKFKAVFFNDIIEDPEIRDITHNVVETSSITQASNSFLFKFGENPDQVDELITGADNFRGFTLNIAVNSKAGLSSYSSAGFKAALVLNLNKFFIKPGFISTTWFVYFDNVFEYKHAEGETEVVSPSTYSRMIEVDESVLPFAPLYPSPITNRVSNMVYMDVPVSKYRAQNNPSFSDCPLRYYIYHGLQDDNFSEDYPYLAIDKRDYAGNTISGSTMALRWNHTDGLIALNWTEFIEMVEEEKSKTVLLDWSVKEFYAFSFLKKYRIDRVDYLFKELDITLGIHRIEHIKATCVKL